MNTKFEALKNHIIDSNVNTILIFPHVLPDGDTLGSAIGVYRLIRDFNKTGYIVLDDDIPSNLSFLFEANRDIVISLEKAKKMAYELIIVVDTGEPKLIGDRTALISSNIPTINIDHHITNQDYAHLNIVEPEASSTGELVYKILDYLKVEIDVFTAQGLYAAIVTDTGSFRYSNTRPYTFEVCKSLVEKGFDFNRLNVEIFQNKSFEKLLLLNKIFDTLSLHFDGKCAIVKLSESLKNQLALEVYDTDGVVEYVRDIKGVEVVVFIKHMVDNEHKISMRSKNNFDVSRVAVALGGGGHKKAAGFKAFKSDYEIESAILKMIGESI
ncbi:DHH family phosphoesterase [Fusibacter ferrireducens]|uniref:Bifunctional oligoribonuclease/PAP phosphatase NrnA n=1 Tax=Fusibacter ferrireducens TaxID=2785058 RepID=A0ABR9ZNS0_9FIRM|nr:bifunctional oligoribonuclease/PAP phosphatase NrnA [Fusibacter ferrireducens]MBF4691773.1 bifunctional oligoribonuclease/PAP phosphatase NrnA [Fusibacter ferrireducens]